MSLILLVSAQELHSTFRLPFQTLGLQPMRYMNCCILHPFRVLTRRRDIVFYTVAHDSVCRRGEKRICNENEM